MTKTDVVNAYGNERFIIQALKEDKSAYLPNATNLQGLVNFSMTFTQDETEFAADNVPDYIVTRGTPKGDGNATFRGLSPQDYELLYAVISGTNGVWFGADLPVTRFGLVFDESVTIDGIPSINRYVIFNCRANNLPEVNTKTVANDDDGRRDMSVSITASPIFYDKADGSKGRAIFAVFNSALHKTNFDLFAESLVMPTEAMINGG